MKKVIRPKSIQASVYKDTGSGIGKFRDTFTLKELEDLYDEMKDYDPVVQEYSSFDEWLKDTVNNGYLEEIRSATNTCGIPAKPEIISSEDLNDEEEWFKVVSKPVRDSDGFMTEYTMWFNNYDGAYVFIFGDPDLYTPENAEPDWECDDYDAAVEWYNDYNGFEEDEYDY